MKRYHFMEGSVGSMEEFDDGDYILYSDHVEELQKEKNRRVEHVQRNKDLNESLYTIDRELRKLRVELNRARQERYASLEDQLEGKAAYVVTLDELAVLNACDRLRDYSISEDGFSDDWSAFEPVAEAIRNLRESRKNRKA